jgi:hypothetical protein
VLNPGVVIGRQSFVYPAIAVPPGIYGARSRIKG